MKKTIILYLVFFTLIPHAFAIDCDEPQTQSAMNYCTEKLYQEVDKELNQVYHKILKCISGEHTKLLKTSQNLWIKYRDAERMVSHKFSANLINFFN